MKNESLESRAMTVRGDIRDNRGESRAQNSELIKLRDQRWGLRSLIQFRYEMRDESLKVLWRTYRLMKLRVDSSIPSVKNLRVEEAKNQKLTPQKYSLSSLRKKFRAE